MRTICKKFIKELGITNSLIYGDTNKIKNILDRLMVFAEFDNSVDILRTNTVEEYNKLNTFEKLFANYTLDGIVIFPTFVDVLLELTDDVAEHLRR